MTLSPPLARAAARSVSAARSKRALASVTFFALRSAPSDPASSAVRFSGFSSEVRATLIPTVGARASIFARLSSGTNQRSGAGNMLLISRSGLSAAYFSTLNCPQAVPRLVSSLTSMSPACGFGFPATGSVGPKTPVHVMP